MSELYKEMRIASSARAERNDCSIIAVAIAKERKYGTILKKFDNVGRKSRRGVSFNMISEVVGKEFVYLRKPNGGQYTARTIGKVLNKGRYVVLFRGHVAACVDGIIHDWTSDRCYRVIGYWKV